MKRKTKLQTAASNARALMAQFYSADWFDHKGFLAEMDRRAASVGKPLTAEQYALLGRMAQAYIQERAT
jgi:hypothetical protein